MGVLTPDIVAKEALIVLENELVMGGLVHRGYSTEFQSVGSTVRIRVPTTLTANTVGNTVEMGTLSEGTVDVVLDQHQDISLTITSKDLTTDIADFSIQVIQPMMRAHAQRVDAQLCGLYVDIAGHYPVNATPAVSDIAGVRAVMNVLKAPMGQRRLVHDPITEAKYISLNSFLNAEKRGDTRAIREASMGRVLGFDHYMDQNIKTHTTGGYSQVSGSVVVLEAAGTADGTVVKMKNGINTGTINVGDIFKVTGYDEWHVVTTEEISSGGAGTATVEFQPPMKTAYTSGYTVEFQDTHRASLAFHKNAFALVTAPLDLPLGGAKGGVLSYKGITARVVYGYNFLEKFNYISLDMLYGVKTLDRNLAARLSDAN